ncbi:phage tail tip lysozyme [Inquilinus limosus]|uniref:phage tail tip lysozyme n=1 Tax=Inquilinus limosus TaxID=171674 RepID=UPI0003FEB07D|nr:phage tail tip lysozyme [Inquilinus limosus]
MNERAQAAYAYFKAKGYPDVAAAAIVGNLVQESNLNPDAVHDNGTGLGIAGWRDPEPGKGRKTALIQFATERGKTPNDLTTQFAFLAHELETSEAGIGQRLRNAKTLEEANDIFIGFERPRGWTKENPRGGDGWQNRLNYARQIMEGDGSAAPLPSNPDLGGAVDPAPVPRLEQRQEELRQEAEGPGLWNTLTAAVNQDSVTAHFIQERPEFAPDLNFRLDEQRLKDLQKQYGLTEDSLAGLDEAMSSEHADWLAQQLRDRQDREETLAQAGVTGMVTRLAVNMLDPASLALAIASGGLGELAVAGRGLSALGRAGVFAGVEGAAAGGLEAVDASITPGVGERDVLMAAGAGMILGAGFGALSRTAPDLAEPVMRIGKELRETTSLTPAPGSTAGAMQANATFPLRDDVRIWENVSVPQTAFAGRLRQDLTGWLKSSDNAVFRALGNVLAEDAVGNRNGTIATAFGASEDAARLHHRMSVRVQRSVLPAWNAWAKERNLGFVKKQWGPAWDEFNDQVSAFMRNTDPSVTFDPNVVKAGEAFRAAYADFVKMAQNPGLQDGSIRRAIKGYEKLDPNDNYVPRLYDFNKLNKLFLEIGQTGVVQLYKKALLDKQPNLEDEVAHRVAEGMVKKLRQRDAGLSSRLDRPLGSDDQDYLVQSLKDLGVDELDAQSLAKQLRPQEDSANPSRGKFRALLNEHATITAPNGRVIRFDELLHNNAMDLFHAYSRDMSGRIALGRIRVRDADGNTVVDGITSDNEFGSLIDAARAYGEFKGLKDTEKGVKQLQTIYRAIIGTPDPSDSGELAQLTRTIMLFNFVRLMNNMGWAQAVELGSIIGNLGLRATIQGVPSFRALIRDAKTGSLGDDLGNELEAVFGIGADDLKGAMPYRWDDDYFGDSMSPAWARVDQGLREGARVVSTISGMRYINRFLQTTAMRGIVYKFADLARNPTKANLRRMASLGLDEKMLGRVLEQFKANASRASGEFGKVTRLNLDQWEDVEARAAFEGAVFRWARRIVQENDPGALPYWMQNRFMKAAFQFRTFMIGSFFKQTLWHMNMRDREALATAMFTMMLGGTIYAAQTSVQSIGRPDREKYLKERLSEKNIALAAFQRTGMASIIPMLVDTARFSSGFDPMFSGRTTGLQNDPFFGNPTVALYGDLSSALGSIVQPIFHGRQPSQQEYRQATRALPFGNSMFLTVPLNALISGAPQRAPRDE